MQLQRKNDQIYYYMKPSPLMSQECNFRAQKPNQKGLNEYTAVQWRHFSNCSLILSQIIPVIADIVIAVIFFITVFDAWIGLVVLTTMVGYVGEYSWMKTIKMIQSWSTSCPTFHPMVLKFPHRTFPKFNLGLNGENLEYCWYKKCACVWWN